MASASGSARVPAYSLSSTEKDVEYTVQIPEMKVTKSLFGPPKIENGALTCDIYERGFTLKFIGRKELINKDYELPITDFPSTIYVPKSSWKPRSNAVDVKLRVCENPKEVEEKLREERKMEDPSTAN